MMNKAYQQDFERGLSTLEDIQLLSEFSVSPLVSHAYFYLSEIKRKADAIVSGQVAEYDAVSQVLDEKLSTIVSDYFGDKGRFKGFTYSKSTKQINLNKWNLILNTIPELLSVVSLFNYHGNVDIHFDENRLNISGMILENGKLELNRKFIYVVTRKLLRQKVLLTFKLDETARTGLFKLTLRADISHDPNLIYRVNFKLSNQEQYLVGLSNIVCQYRTQLSDVKSVGDHHIIDISSDLSIKHFFGLPELTRMESANKEILHFPFLFRPISIILPVKGSLVTDTFSRSLDDENKRKQDVSKYFRTIDFFSLFNF